MKHLLQLITLLTLAFAIAPLAASAQLATLTSLYDSPGTLHSVSLLSGGLVEGDDGNFYGTSSGGGAYSEGSVYQITPGGTLTVIHSF